MSGSKPITYLAVERDRRVSTHEVNEQEDFAGKVIRSANDGIVAYNRDLRYTVWNPTMERLTGMPEASVLGKSAFEVFPFLRESGRDRLFFEALAGRCLSIIHHFTPPATGVRVDVISAHSPLRDEFGRIVGGLGIIREITEERRIQAELERLRARVSELERELGLRG